MSTASLPNPITVSSRVRLEEDSSQVVEGVIDLGNARAGVQYRLPAGSFAERADSMLAVALLPAMKLARPIWVDGIVSPRLAHGVQTVQDIFHIWDPVFRKIPIETRTAVPEGQSGTGVGLFFSGGLDSFYSLLKHRDEITDLIHVDGFEFRSIKDASFRQQILDTISEIAAQFRKRLIVVNTNLREFSDRYVGWDFYNGSGLASVALLLSPRFRKIYIGATHSYAGLCPLGSHPMLDPLWGTEITDIVHDGCEATRVAKARLIASSQIALRLLRVCWEGRGETYNCGRCEKCVRTMVNLHLAGVLERCSSFDRPLDLGAVARIRLAKESLRVHALENLREAEALNNQPDLVRALRRSLNRRYHLKRLSMREVSLAHLRRILRLF